MVHHRFFHWTARIHHLAATDTPTDRVNVGLDGALHGHVGARVLGD
jgi:hypothetical protein